MNNNTVIKSNVESTITTYAHTDEHTGGMHNAPGRVRDRAQQTAKMPRIYDVCIAVRRLYAMRLETPQLVQSAAIKST